MEKKSRNPNNASSIYKGGDGYWHGRVTVGVRDDGRPDRRHVSSKSRADVVKKVRALERAREEGKVQAIGQHWTVRQWLEHWLENIARPSVRENTYSGYRVDVHVHLIPAIGAHKLRTLQPEHLERLYVRMQANGSKPATAHHVHRTVRTALGEAERRGHLPRNPARLAKAPRVEELEVEPFTVEEVQRILEAAALHPRNSSRWALALALGLRQGEVLGLQWSDVDHHAGSITIRRGRQRPRYAHGCQEPCGMKHAGRCPDRQSVRAETAETKSRAGRRVIGLPDQLRELLVEQQREQQADRERAGQLWTEHGYVFANELGAPLNPRTDWDRWKRLLADAGIRDARLHDARHTAATVLLLLGVPDRAVMSLMGWSKTDMTARYQHVTAVVRRDVAGKLQTLLWVSPAAPRDD